MGQIERWLNRCACRRRWKKSTRAMWNVFGCGIDIEDLSRFDKYVANKNYSLMRDICTKSEFNNLIGEKRTRFALSFSFKEAFFKALGGYGANNNVFWKDIGVVFLDTGLKKYELQVSEKAKKTLKENNVKIGESACDYNEEFVMFQIVLLKLQNNES